MGGGSESKSGSAQKWAEPIATSAANSATGVYNAAAPGLQQTAAQVQGMMPGLQQQYGQTSQSMLGLGDAFTAMLNPLSNAANGTYANNQNLSGQMGGVAQNLLGNVGGPNMATSLMPYVSGQLGTGNSLNGLQQQLGGMFGGLTRNANMQNNMYNQTAGGLASQIPGLLQQNGQNGTLNAAQNYATGMLNGNAGSNPALQSIINSTNRNVTDAVNSQFEQSGRYGSGAYANALGQGLASNEGNLRYQDYQNQQQNMNQMAGLAPSLAGAQQQYSNNGLNQALNVAGALPGLTGAGQQSYNTALGAAGQIGNTAQAQSGINSSNINNYLNAATTDSNIGNTNFSQAMTAANGASGLDQASYGGLNAMFQAAGMIPGYNQASYSGLPEMLNTATTGAQLPYTGMNAYSNSLGALFNGGTQKQSNGIGGIMQGIGSLASGVGAMGSGGIFSDRRLKRDIEHIRTMEDGLNVYSYHYNDTLPHLPEGKMIGVMADEVAQLRPWALGPVVDGFATVNYGAL